MSITVRKAQTHDLDSLLPKLREFSQFLGTLKPLFPEDESHARRFIGAMITEHVFLVAETNQSIIGFLGAIYTLHHFNPEIQVLAEQFFWVDEEHRGTRAGLLLLNEFVAWGSVNADQIVFTRLPQSEMSERSLIKRGFRFQETQYLKECTREAS